MIKTNPGYGISTATAVLLAALLVPGHGAESTALVLTRSIELPSTKGRLDHLSINVEGGQLFVVALAAGSVDVIDLSTGKRTGRIEGLHEPQGVVYLPGTHRLLVANGSGGGVSAFVDGKPSPAGNARALADADNLRFDPAGGRLYAGYAHALAVIDPTTMQVTNHTELAGHPEAFELEGAGARIFINVPSAHHVAVVDRNTGQVTATWRIEGAAQNFAMALDESSRRLFVATRRPASLLVYDTLSGRRTAQASLCSDADDLFFDAKRHRLYAICGEGIVQIIHQRDADHYETAESVRTSPGARTGLFVPEISALFVALPAVQGSPAVVRAYEIK